MKTRIIPSHLINGPENPGKRWDARYLMILADMLDPQLTVAQVADLLENPEDKKKHALRYSELWRAANSEKAAELLAANFGSVVTDRTRDRWKAVFQELLRRHRIEQRGQQQSIASALEQLDRRFGAEQVAEALLAT